MVCVAVVLSLAAYLISVKPKSDEPYAHISIKATKPTTCSRTRPRVTKQQPQLEPACVPETRYRGVVQRLPEVPMNATHNPLRRSSQDCVAELYITSEFLRAFCAWGLARWTWRATSVQPYSEPKAAAEPSPAPASVRVERALEGQVIFVVVVEGTPY
jgi:hypothetical protein